MPQNIYGPLILGLPDSGWVNVSPTLKFVKRSQLRIHMVWARLRGPPDRLVKLSVAGRQPTTRRRPKRRSSSTSTSNGASPTTSRSSTPASCSARASLRWTLFPNNRSKKNIAPLEVQFLVNHVSPVSNLTK